MEADNETIIALAREHNVGDLALNLRPNQTSRNKRQRFALRSNIDPSEVINRNHPTDNYQFAWCPFKDTDFYHDLKDEGYKPVIEGEWVLNRDGFEWYMPDKDRWRWSETRMLVNRDEFLMYRSETLWQQEMDRRNQVNEESIGKRNEATAEAAAQTSRDKNLGIEVEMNGRVTNAGTRRTIVT